ncbi:HYR domain-containing protein [Salinimicrobium sp. TIG7-5_MAKvit]|uniref:HYR domain-containing protein n=1 Tax=Salinimicrobium sp. TIG7-5_MAKvit TaxID=3121289 RepID=UPI003C6E5D0E
MRRLHAIQKCHFTAVLLRHFFGCDQNTRGLKNAIFERLFLLFFLLNCGGLSLLGQNPADEVPVYDWDDVSNVGSVGVSNPEDIIISVDTDSEDFVYTLSFGNGVDQRSTDGTLMDGNFIPGGELDAPLDFAIDEQGYFYIIDYSDNDPVSSQGKIRVFDPEGNPDRVIGTGFYRPMGIDVDSENIYIAEYYDGSQGPEQGSEFSRISIFSKQTGLRTNYNDSDVEIPYRIAVNSKGLVFVSQAGDEDPAVLIFDENLNFDRRLSNIQSPGSLVIDSFDFIHVIEYAGRIDFGQFINFQSIDETEAIQIALDINQGIRDNAFGIKIFTPVGGYEDFYKEELDFPIDLAFNNCEKMFVNNATVTTFLGIPLGLNFELEIYNRIPTFDSLEGPTITCPEDIEVTAEAGNNFAEVEFDDAEATDNCSATVEQTFGDSSGSEFLVGTHRIEFTATDSFGNESTCEFKITVLPSEEEDLTPPDFFNCGDLNVSTDPGKPGAVVNFNPTASDENGWVEVKLLSELGSGEEFPIGTTTVIFEAVNTAGTTTCEFTVTVIDDEDPVITCPGDIPVLVDPGECEVRVTFPGPKVTDNSGNWSLSNDGPDSGSFFPVGKTEIEFKATDPSGNFATCILTIIVDDEEAPVFNACPPDSLKIEAVDDRFFVPNLLSQVNAVDNCDDAIITYSQVPEAGEEIFSNTTLRIYAYDNDASGEDNQSTPCQVELIIENLDPLEITCSGDQTEDIQGSCDFSIPDYTPLASASPGATITQSPAEGTVVDDKTTIRLTATLDGATDFCEFEVNLINQAELIISCPGDQTEDADSVGRFSLPDYRGLANVTDDCEQFTVAQSPGEGTVIEEDTTIILTVTDVDGNEDSCEFEVQLVLPGDPDPLEIICPATSTPSFGDNCAFELPDYTSSATVYSSTAQITQDPPAGTLIYGRTEITLTATEGVETVECSFMVDPVDDDKPIITCRNDLEIHLNADGFGVIPPEILLSSIEDNCGIDNVSLSKSRFETSDVGENDILVTVEDVNGNVETCEATVNVVPYDPITDIGCVDAVELELDQNGYKELNLTYTGEEEDIQLELSKKDFTCDDIGLPQMITATYNGQYTGTCEVEVTVVDKLAPRVNCISKIDLVLDANGQGQLSVEDVDLNSLDNCKIEDMSLSKSNFTTEDVGTQTVRFTVTDASGNSDFCEVVVNVRPFMGTGGDLDCVEEVILQLDNDGNAILKAEDLFDGEPSGIDFYGENTYTCEDLGTNYITFSKLDDPSQTCEIKVVVEDNIAPVAHCKADYVLTLGANGTATLSPENFGAGSTDNCGITSMSLNRTSFTTADVGQQQLLLTVTDNSGNVDICETPILVQPYEENPSGIECKALFVLALNANGSAQLQPQDLFTGGMSGAYNVSQSIFTCEDLGENEVVLSYTTVNGSGSCTVKVMVEDPQIVCDSSPAPERDSLIMYPNPGDGLISFELSPGLQINRIEIFDFRGRFLREQQYDNSQPIPNYQLDLSAYQAGVYPLVIYTNGREYLKRAIIK